MRGKVRLIGLASVSAIAALAATLWPADEARACDFIETAEGVDVRCPAPGAAFQDDTHSPFKTSYSDPTYGTVLYDGNGADTIRIGSGAGIAFLNEAATLAPPPGIGGLLDEVSDAIMTLGGHDRFEMSDGQIGAVDSWLHIDLGDDDDAFEMTGGTIHGIVLLGDGKNKFVLHKGFVSGAFAGSGNDTFEINGGRIGEDQIPPDIDMGGGDDRFVMRGGIIDQDVLGGDGDDYFEMSGVGQIGTDEAPANIVGGAGLDTVQFNAGILTGDIEAEIVTLYGGSIGGDINLGGQHYRDANGDVQATAELVIDDSVAPEALNLRDGVTFTGWARGTIRNTDLAAMGSQNFKYFIALDVIDSTLRFNGGTHGIDLLALSEGSTLFANGTTTLGANLSLSDSTLNMIDGATDDILTLGGVSDEDDQWMVSSLTLNDATIAIDFDQQAGLVDTLAVNGPVTITGNNIVAVNLLGTPDPAALTEVTLISSGVPVNGAFTVTGIPDDMARLFDYRVLSSADGLTLRATPYGVITALDATANDRSAVNMTEALHSISEDAIDHGLGLSPGAPVGGSPNLAVFASGQWAKVDHDGFSISNGPVGFQGPSFSADEFSAAISLDFNAARHFGYDQEYGLNLGIFGGYASTDLELDRFNGFDAPGWGRNESAMAGGYALLRKQTSYLLVSAMGLFGNTHVNNQVIGGTGDYDTTGYALNASAGRIFALSDTIRLDLRGGILGAWFTGDSYTDSAGLTYGKSKLSFGAVRFEPGIYADRLMENGMVFSPYLRGELAQRFGYSNTSSVAGQEFEFDDADFSAALSAGFNLKVSKSATVSLEGRARASSDSTTGAGKLGLKVAF